MRAKSTAMDGEGTGSPGVLEIRVAQGPADWIIAHRMLDEEHLLGAGREAGDRLCQFVLEDGQPVAVLVWCAAAWLLKDLLRSAQACFHPRHRIFTSHTP